MSGPTLSPSELAQDRRGEVIGASVTLLILPTVAVALRLLSRWVSRAGFWVSCLTFTDKRKDLSSHQWDDFTIIVACVRILEMLSGKWSDDSKPYSFFAGVLISSTSPVSRFPRLEVPGHL